MKPNHIFNQMLDFNKTVYEHTWKQMNILQELTETQINTCIDQTPSGPEVKKAAKEVIAMHKKSFEDCRTLMDGNMKKMHTLFRLKPE